MPIDHDPSPDKYQQWFGLGTFFGGAIAAGLSKLIGRGKRARSEQYMRAIAREALNREILESERWQSIERRLEAIEYHRREDRSDIDEQFNALHRRLDRLQSR